MLLVPLALLLSVLLFLESSSVLYLEESVGCKVKNERNYCSMPFYFFLYAFIIYEMNKRKVALVQDVTMLYKKYSCHHHPKLILHYCHKKCIGRREQQRCFTPIQNFIKRKTPFPFSFISSLDFHFSLFILTWLDQSHSRFHHFKLSTISS